MTDRHVNRKLTTLLSADAVGYSRLMGDDDAATVETLQEYRLTMRRVIERHQGRVVNVPGDALLSEFPSAVEAVECAVEIQKALDGRNVELAPDRRMEFRIGVNIGDVIEENDGTLYGDGVNIAARMEALADAGGICISSPVFDAIEGKVDFGFDFLGAQKVKNITKPINVYRVRSEPGVRPRRGGAVKPAHRRAAAIGGAVVLFVLLAGVVVWLLVDRLAEPTTIAEPPALDREPPPAEPTASVAEPPALDAYDLVAQAGDALQQGTRAANAEAAELFAQAIELDPEFAEAYIGLGLAHTQRWQRGWSRDPADLDQALELGQKAKVLNPWFAQVHGLLGQAHLWRREHDAALEAAARAIELEPSDADANHVMAQVLVFAGRPDEAIGHVEKAMRLNPGYSWVYAWTLGLAATMAGQTDAATSAFEEIIETNPDVADAHAMLAVVHADAGRSDDARAAYSRLTDLDPAFGVEALQVKLPFKDPSALDRIGRTIAAIQATVE